MRTVRHVRSGVLDQAFHEDGPADGAPVVLLHGFPYDPHAFDAVTPILVGQGLRVVTPYLRGYGPTRFLEPAILRSGQQGALGADLLALLDALDLPRAMVAGFDWGGRAACVLAALWPERVSGLVSVGGYNIQDIAAASRPLPPETEHRFCYQFYMHGERGAAGLRDNRDAFCRLLWDLWSPTWPDCGRLFAQTAASFDSPDFVPVVLHSYRHRFGLVAGDPAYDEIERRLAAQPPIAVPTVALEGRDDGVGPPAEPDEDRARFTGRYRRELLAGVGHNLPQEAPEPFARAVLELATP